MTENNNTILVISRGCLNSLRSTLFVIDDFNNDNVKMQFYGRQKSEFSENHH